MLPDSLRRSVIGHGRDRVALLATVSVVGTVPNFEELSVRRISTVEVDALAVRVERSGSRRRDHEGEVRHVGGEVLVEPMF